MNIEHESFTPEGANQTMHPVAWQDDHCKETPKKRRPQDSHAFSGPCAMPFLETFGAKGGNKNVTSEYKDPRPKSSTFRQEPSKTDNLHQKITDAILLRKQWFF